MIQTLTYPQALGLFFAFGAGFFLGAWLLGFLLDIATREPTLQPDPQPAQTETRPHG